MGCRTRKKCSNVAFQILKKKDNFLVLMLGSLHHLPTSPGIFLVLSAQKHHIQKILKPDNHFCTSLYCFFTSPFLLPFHKALDFLNEGGYKSPHCYLYASFCLFHMIMYHYYAAFIVCSSETLEDKLVYCLNMDIINSH